MICTTRHGTTALPRDGMLAAIVLLATLASSPWREATAHIVMGTQSLHLRVAEADLIVRGRVLDPHAPFVSEDGLSRRELVEIRVLEVVKGKTASPMPTLRVAQDGHEVARYQAGDEALFFLEPIATSRELRALAVTGGATHVSGQEHDEPFLLAAPSGPLLFEATQMLVASESAATPEARIALVRRATIELLCSGDAQLGAAALASLVLTPKAALVTEADVPRLEQVLDDSSVSIGFRAGLLAELERRGLVDGPVRWLALLESPPPATRAAAIRAAGAHPSEPVKARLIALLADPESPTAIAAEAAIALGASRDLAMAGALATALASPESRLRNAAIRGLGQLGGPEARRVLAETARSHSDPLTRRRAGAALDSLRSRAARLSAPARSPGP